MTPQQILSRHVKPQSANEASKVLEQGLFQNNFAVGKPRAMGIVFLIKNVCPPTLRILALCHIRRQIGFHQRKCLATPLLPVCSQCGGSIWDWSPRSPNKLGLPQAGAAAAPTVALYFGLKFVPNYCYPRGITQESNLTPHSE